MLDKIIAWFGTEEDEAPTNGDNLRTFVENLFKAVANLLSLLGEWPIDFE